jgi:hypothetical protein
MEEEESGDGQEGRRERRHTGVPTNTGRKEGARRRRIRNKRREERKASRRRQEDGKQDEWNENDGRRRGKRIGVCVKERGTRIQTQRRETVRERKAGES